MEYLKDYRLELSVLSTLKYRGKPEIIPLFFTSIFESFGTRAVFKFLKDHLLEGKPADPRYILDALRNKDEQLFVNITLNKLNEKDCLSDAAMIWAAARLKQLYFYRTAKKIQEKADRAMKENKIKKVVGLTSEVERLYSRLFLRAESKDFFASSVDMANNEREYIKTPYRKLNNIIGGWTNKGLSCIGAKSSHNKTTFSVHMITNELKLGYLDRALIISMDEPGEMIARRIIASEMNISLSDMRDKKVKLSKKDVMDAMKIFGKRLIIIDDIFTPDEIYEAMMDIKASQTLIDHIQEPAFDEGMSDASITRLLTLIKHAAVKTNTQVLALSQVRDKTINERADKVPRSHDFYYSSTIRQKSREQLVLYWRYVDTLENAHFNTLEIYPYKSTYSRIGKPIRLYYEPDYARFSDQFYDRDLLPSLTGDSVS